MDGTPSRVCALSRSSKDRIKSPAAVLGETGRHVGVGAWNLRLMSALTRRRIPTAVPILVELPWEHSANPGNDGEGDCRAGGPPGRCGLPTDGGSRSPRARAGACAGIGRRARRAARRGVDGGGEGVSVDDIAWMGLRDGRPVRSKP